MSTALASIKSSFIARVNHHAATVRRQRSTTDCDVTSGMAADAKDGPAHGGVQVLRLLYNVLSCTLFLCRFLNRSVFSLSYFNQYF